MSAVEWAIVSGLVSVVLALIGVVYATLERRVSNLDHPTTGALPLTAAEARRSNTETRDGALKALEAHKAEAAAALQRVKDEIVERQHRHAGFLQAHGEELARIGEHRTNVREDLSELKRSIEDMRKLLEVALSRLGVRASSSTVPRAPDLRDPR